MDYGDDKITIDGVEYPSADAFMAESKAAFDDSFNKIYRQHLPMSVQNELMELAYQDAKAAGHDRLARQINRDGMLKYKDRSKVFDKRFNDMIFRTNPVQALLREKYFEGGEVSGGQKEKHGGGQAEARRIVDMLREKKGKKSALDMVTDKDTFSEMMRLTKPVPKISFKFVEKVATDPFGLAAENAASDFFGLKSKPTEFQNTTGSLEEDF